MTEEETETTEPESIFPRTPRIIIPTCCSEGREDCKHCVQKQRPDKRNVGI